MSISYIIIFDKKLEKKEFLYKNILKDKISLFSQNDGIIFDDKLWISEKNAINNIINKKHIYSIRASVPLSYEEKDIAAVNNNYYLCEKQQMEWLFEFVKNNLKNSKCIYFIQLALGENYNNENIKTKDINVNEFKLPEKCFEFDELTLYKFTSKK